MKLFNTPFQRLFPPITQQLAPAGAGSTMMFARSSGGSGNRGGGNDGGDDYGYLDDDPDDYTPPTRSRTPRATGGGGSGDSGGRQRTTQFQSEERYWTEYLRIALPVIGLLLMLGLFWYWAQSLINDDDNTTEPVATETVGQADLETPTVEPTTEATEAPADSVTPTAEPTTPPTAAPTTAPTEESAATEESASTGELVVGGTATVNDDDVNLRPDASTAGDAVAVLASGDELTIIGGPEEAEDYVWWQVETSDGTQGWVVEDFIDPSGS